MTWTAEKGKRKLMKLLKNWVSHMLQAQWYLHICHYTENCLKHVKLSTNISKYCKTYDKSRYHDITQLLLVTIIVSTVHTQNSIAD